MKKILIMAGGTGGHVFPGLAVAKELTSNGEFEVLWLGTKERMEAKLVPQYGFNISFINIQGLRRNGLIRKLLSPFKIFRAILAARKVINNFKPDVVLGLGGYASGPGGVAAYLQGVPLVLHEQNAAPGLTNRILSKLANQVLLGFPNAIDSAKAKYVGNPVRKDVLDIQASFPREYGNTLRIAVVGGSLGAEALNKTVPNAFAKCLINGCDVSIVHQTGKGNSLSVNEVYKSLGAKNFQVNEFIDDMAGLYKNTDLIICRAGALTVAEVSAAGVPAIFVPLPTAVDDHQTKNARTLSDNGAAICLPQSELTSDKLFEIISELSNDHKKLADMSFKAYSLAKRDATEVVAQECRKLAGVLE